MGYTGSLTGILTVCHGLSKNPHITGDFIPKSKRPLAPMPLAPKQGIMVVNKPSKKGAYSWEGHKTSARIAETGS